MPFSLPTLGSQAVVPWPETLNTDRFFLRDRIEEGRGDRIAVRHESGELTFTELDAMASGYARLLRAQGAGKRDRVLIILPDGPHFAAAFFGTLRVGGVVVMLNPGLTPDTLGGIVEESRAAAAIVDPQHLDHYRSSLVTWEPQLVESEPGMALSGGDEATEPTSPDDPALWLFSGGTTGAPKAVVQRHKSLVNTTRLYGQGALGLNEKDITISVPKLYFGYAAGSNLLFPFSVGASAVLFDEHPTPDVLFDQIERHRPTVLVNVPSAINQMLKHPGAENRDMSSLRFATSAGEALPESLYHRWKETFGVELLDGLGTAEMWHIFISNTLGDVRPGTLGRVVPGFDVEARDDDEEEVPRGEVGRLWVRGESLALGYHDDPEKTAEAFRGEWFVGGDLVSVDGEGYVTHRGRADDAVKVKGKWFRPQEVESVLLGHDAVKACAVVAAEDEAGLTRPVAFVVPEGEVEEADLVDWVLSRLEPYKHPRRVFFVEELPQTHLGKVDRAELKRRSRV